MMSFFNELLYRPLFNALVFLYQTVSFYDFGVAIILLTVIIRAVLYPLSRKAIRSQKEMSSIQKDVKALQEKYKNDKEEQMKRIMALYKEKKINPFSGCLPMIVQIPILIALYKVFMAGFQDQNLEILYGFIPNPGFINHMFLGFLDISKRNLIPALIAGTLQFYQSKMMLDQQKIDKPSSERDFSSALSSQMTYMMPVVTVIFAYSLPSGLALYWITTTLFSIIQQWLVLKKKPTN